MRVGVDVTPLIGAPTGIARTTSALVEELLKDPDVEVTGWLMTGRGRLNRSDIVTQGWSLPAALTHRLWAHIDFPPGRLVTGAVDIVHGTNFVVPPAPRRVVTVHDTSPLQSPQWCTPAVARFAPLIQRAINTGATVHVPSVEVGRQLLAQTELSDDRLAVIANPITPLAPNGPTTDAATGRRLAGHQRYLLAIGRTEPRKNLIQLVDSFAAAAPDDVALVIGGPVGSSEQSLQARVEHHGLNTRYRRITDLNDTQLAALVRGATALAYPSRLEGFGLPPLEALLAGTPVAATAVGALPELIGASIELAPPGDGPQFTGLLEATLSDPPIVAESLKDSLAQLTPAANAAALTELYRSL